MERNIRISDIKVVDRIRKDIGDVTELANSIKEVGLIHPPTVIEQNKQFILVAGERRLTALKQLGNEFATFRVIESTSPELVTQMEIEENELRKPFTKEERVQLIEIRKRIEKDKLKRKKLEEQGIELELPFAFEKEIPSTNTPENTESLPSTDGKREAIEHAKEIPSTCTPEITNVGVHTCTPEVTLTRKEHTQVEDEAAKAYGSSRRTQANELKITRMKDFFTEEEYEQWNNGDTSTRATLELLAERRQFTTVVIEQNKDKLKPEIYEAYKAGRKTPEETYELLHKKIAKEHKDPAKKIFEKVDKHKKPTVVTEASKWCEGFNKYLENNPLTLELMQKIIEEWSTAQENKGTYTRTINNINLIRNISERIS